MIVVMRSAKQCKKDYDKLRSYVEQVDAYRKDGICTDLVVQYDKLIRTFKSIYALYALIEPYLVEKSKK